MPRPQPAAVPPEPAPGDAALPPMPTTETERLGFIADPDAFAERTLDIPVAPGPFAPTWESIARHRPPAWWNDDKFGIFIHWGPQAAGRSGDWYARNLYDENHEAYRNHLAAFGHPSEVGYKDVLHRWRPDAWDPEAIVNAYRDAGFRYALVVGVHHDNYDLWDSRHHPWNSVAVGPKQDFLAGWKRELSRAGMRFGVAFHHEYTWWWWQQAFGADSKGEKAGIPYDGSLTAADGRGQWWEGLDPRRLYGIPLPYTGLSQDGLPYDVKDIAFGRRGIFGNHLAYAQWYATQWAARITDVVDRYDPDFIYTDGNGEFPFSGVHSASGYKCDAAARVVADFYNKAAARGGDTAAKLAVVKFLDRCPGVASTYEGCYAADPVTHRPWMADMAVGDWYYRPGFRYDGRMVILALLEHASRGGNLTLCVSLTPEGAIDAGSAAMMADVGRWLRQHGEGIYGSTAWSAFAEGDPVTNPARPNEPAKIRILPGGKLGDTHADFRFAATDYRFTRGRDGSVYVWVLETPAAGATVAVRALGTDAGLFPGPIASVRLTGSETELTCRRDADALRITWPDGIAPGSVAGIRVR